MHANMVDCARCMRMHLGYGRDVCPIRPFKGEQFVSVLTHMLFDEGIVREKEKDLPSCGGQTHDHCLSG